MSAFSFSFLYKDENIAIIDKPVGVTPDECIEDITNQLLDTHLESPVRDRIVVTPIGQMDRAASGIQIYGLNLKSSRELKKALNSKHLYRGYFALVKGDISKPGGFQFPLMDSEGEMCKSLTCFEPQKSFNIATLLKVWLETDCKDQIRKHFSRRWMPVIGDRKYGQKKWNDFFK